MIELLAPLSADRAAQIQTEPHPSAEALDPQSEVLPFAEQEATRAQLLADADAFLGHAGRKQRTALGQATLNHLESVRALIDSSVKANKVEKETLFKFLTQDKVRRWDFLEHRGIDISGTGRAVDPDKTTERIRYFAHKASNPAEIIGDMYQEDVHRWLDKVIHTSGSRSLGKKALGLAAAIFSTHP